MILGPVVNGRDSSVTELGAGNTVTAWLLGQGRASVCSVTFWTDESLSASREENLIKDFHQQSGSPDSG